MLRGVEEVKTRRVVRGTISPEDFGAFKAGFERGIQEFDLTGSCRITGGRRGRGTKTVIIEYVGPPEKVANFEQKYSYDFGVVPGVRVRRTDEYSRAAYAHAAAASPLLASGHA